MLNVRRVLVIPVDGRYADIYSPVEARSLDEATGALRAFSTGDRSRLIAVVVEWDQELGHWSYPPLRLGLRLGPADVERIDLRQWIDTVLKSAARIDTGDTEIADVPIDGGFDVVLAMHDWLPRQAEKLLGGAGE